MIFKSTSAKYEKVFFLVFRTKIQKVSEWTQVDFIIIEHSFKRFIKIFWNSVISFSYSLGVV